MNKIGVTKCRQLLLEQAIHIRWQINFLLSMQSLMRVGGENLETIFYEFKTSATFK